MEPCKIEVRYADIDSMGHVNNAIYLTYIEQGRIHFFSQLLVEEIDWKKFGIIVARNEVDYLQPLVLGDEVYVSGTISEIGNKSFKMKMEVFKKLHGKDVTCARGLVTLVCFDYHRMQTIPIPEEWLIAARKL